MNPSNDQLQALCSQWAIDITGKEQAEIEALFWKTVCERRMSAGLCNRDRIPTDILVLLNPCPVQASLHARAALWEEWTREGFV